MSEKFFISVVCYLSYYNYQIVKIGKSIRNKAVKIKGYPTNDVKSVYIIMFNPFRVLKL